MGSNMQARLGRLALTLAVAAASSACAMNSENRDRVDATRRGVTDAAASPLRDVGILRPEIPDLIETLRYPYASATLSAGCPAILYQIGQLDAVLGNESYQPGEETTLSDRGMEAAQDAAVDLARDATDVIPFRGWVRRVSGASSAERRAARAVELGHTRRAFLRGYGAALGCPGVTPAPPPPEPSPPGDEASASRNVGAPP
jgi:hypothetical protein